ncbi:hypothetical protein F5Y18DRAFT_307524 [Xylariaceae sp. FL1019]|nr:hypothetical protein F5Y18DRAFT_307524 [Xylariaceae sp. FL1019]
MPHIEYPYPYNLIPLALMFVVFFAMTEVGLVSCIVDYFHQELLGYLIAIILSVLCVFIIFEKSDRPYRDLIIFLVELKVASWLKAPIIWMWPYIQMVWKFIAWLVIATPLFLFATLSAIVIHSFRAVVSLVLAFGAVILLAQILAFYNWAVQEEEDGCALWVWLRARLGKGGRVNQVDDDKKVSTPAVSTELDSQDDQAQFVKPKRFSEKCRESRESRE